jgi:oligopeptide transport system substrate-binding protein
MQISRLLLLLFLPFFLLNFSGSSNHYAIDETSRYGGVFHMNFMQDFRSLYPPSIVERSASNIASQVYEGLIKYDPNTLQIVPSLARSWEVNANADEFTFHLRTNVFFHDDECFAGGPGRKLVAPDIKYCFEKLNKESAANYNYINTFKGLIANNDAFKVINDSTFSVRTIHPCSYFLSILTQPACWIYPHEAFDKYGDDMRIHCVGTGPFWAKNTREGEVVILMKNEKYWRTDNDGNKLPYLAAIKFTFIKEKRAETLAFLTDQLDVLAQPETETIISMLDDSSAKPGSGPEFILMNQPLLSVTYYSFLNNKAPFNNLKVRQAFCYAIDKQKIADHTLNGEVVPALHGFIPPGIPGYAGTAVGYEFDVDKARKLLKEAGYPNGKGFPELTLQINSGAGRNDIVAETVVNMLKENLGITVHIDVMPFVQHIETVFDGKVSFWRYGWICDYADPRVFLQLAYGKNVSDNSVRSTINTSRFKNTAFDIAFEKGSAEMNESARMNYYQNAETIAMNNAFVCPLYFESNTQLVKKYVNNYFINGLDVRDLSEVYFVK